MTPFPQMKNQPTNSPEIDKDSIFFPITKEWASEASVFYINGIGIKMRKTDENEENDLKWSEISKWSKIDNCLNDFKMI